MIQRLQSLLLVFLVLTMSSLFFVAIFKKENLQTNETVVMTAIKTEVINNSVVKDSKYTVVIPIIAALVIGASLYSIMQFKNRKNQMLIGLVNTLLLLTMLGFMLYYSTLANRLVSSTTPGKFAFGFFIPAICLILNMIANRFIRRDERLVKDAFDRLR